MQTIKLLLSPSESASQVLPVFLEVICSSTIYRCKKTSKRCLKCDFFAFFSFCFVNGLFLFYLNAKLSTAFQRTRSILSH